MKKLLRDGVGEIAIEPVNETVVIVGRFDVDGSFELSVSRDVGEVDMRRPGVLPICFRGEVSRRAHPDTIMRDGHVRDDRRIRDREGERDERDEQERRARRETEG